MAFNLYHLCIVIYFIIGISDAVGHEGSSNESQTISTNIGRTVSKGYQHNQYENKLDSSINNNTSILNKDKNGKGSDSNTTWRTTRRITSHNSHFTSTKYEVFYIDNGNNKSVATATSAILSRTLLNKDKGCVERRLDLRTIMFIILLVWVFIVAIVSNALAIFVILASRSLRQHPTNLLVASLNFCDIGVILCSVPIRLDNIVYNQFCFDIQVCRFFNATDFLFHISSISHLFAIAIERCVAVRAPFFHRYSLTSKRILQVVGVTWLYSAIWAGLSMFHWERPETITETSNIIFG